MGNDLRSDMENVGRTFTAKSTSLINEWARGKLALPDLLNSAEDIVDTWILNAESKAQSEALRQLDASNDSAIERLERFSRSSDVSRKELNRAIQLATGSGEIQRIFNDITSDFAQRGCDLNKSEICVKLRNEMFGLYVILKRIPELTLQGSGHIVTQQMIGSLLKQLFNGDLGQINNCLVQILRFAEDSNPIYLQQFDYWMNQAYPVYTATQKSLNSDSKLEKYKLINHWRINCAIVNGSFASNADRNAFHTQAAADKLEAIYHNLSNLACNSSQANECDKISPTELYTGLESLLKYFKAQGRIHEAQKIQILEGSLRAYSSELIPNLFERLAYRYIWGKLTDFGTSIYKVLLVWLFGFAVCFGCAASYWSGLSAIDFCDLSLKRLPPFIEFAMKIQLTNRLGPERTARGKALETAVLFMTLRDDPTIVSPSFVNVFRLISFVLVTLAMGYFVYYLSRTF